MDTLPNSELSTRCQWCSQPVPAGAARCPSCGAAVPGPEAPPEAAQLLRMPDEPPAEDSDLPEFLREPSLPEPPPLPLSGPSDVMEGVVQTGVVLAAGGLVGGLFGLLIAPPIVAQIFSTVLENPDIDAGSFRRFGLLVGILFGMLIGAAYGSFSRR